MTIFFKKLPFFWAAKIFLTKATAKFFKVGFIGLPFFVMPMPTKACEKCQKLGSIGRRNMLPLNPILIVELFDVWSIDFMGPFPNFYEYLYILVAIDYISKWVEAIDCKTDDYRVMIQFLKENVFTRFGIPRAIISDGGKHFYNRFFEQLMWYHS